MFFLQVNTIKRALNQTQNNLTLAVKILDGTKADMLSKRHTILHPVDTENILFAQEIAFIRHRKEIENYIRSVEEKEKNEYEALKVCNFILHLWS